MRNACRRFFRSKNGSFAPIMAITAVPLLLAVGLVTDYSSAVSTHSSMQNALDAAALSLIGLPRTATDDDRQAKLQADYATNGGRGTAKLGAAVYDADGTLRISASAGYAMPTQFMSMAMIDNVPIDVASKLVKKPRLIEATFKIDKASGYWNKTITLYGSKPDEKNSNGLMQIKYEYNGKGGNKGYGTTTVLTPDKDGKFNVIKQQEICTSSSNNKNSTASTFRDGSLYTTCKFNSKYGSGATIDVSKMQSLYLQMDVTSGDTGTMRSDDPKTSDFLFLDGVQVKKNQVVDIFTAVPCGQTSAQAWEDGGTREQDMAWKESDFFYQVTGKCDFSQLGSDTRLTQ